jgi:hypothetical protein
MFIITMEAASSYSTLTIRKVAYYRLLVVRVITIIYQDGTSRVKRRDLDVHQALSSGRISSLIIKAG